MNSRPAMYSSTSAGWRYFSTQILTAARSSSSVSTTFVESMPLDEPSAFGFTISGNFMSADEPLARGLHELELRRQDVVLHQHLLAERLVERDRERRRVGAGVRDAEQLAQRGHLRLAVAAFDAFRDVEDQVDIGFCEDARQVRRGLEVDDDVALARERVGDRDDGLRRIPLGLVVAVPG